MTAYQSTHPYALPQAPIVYRIYTLAEPDTGAIRYVGITRVPLKERRARHICDARKSGEKNYRACWLRSLEARGLKPIISEVEVTTDPARERFWIAHFRAARYALVNTSDGMESHVGYITPPEVRTAISAAKRGKPISASHRAALRQAIIGRPVSEATREKIRASQVGKKRNLSPEAIERMIAPHQGKSSWNKDVTRTPEVRRKLSEAQRGKKHSKETRRKISEANKGKPGTMTGRQWSPERRASFEAKRKERGA